MKLNIFSGRLVLSLSKAEFYVKIYTRRRMLHKHNNHSLIQSPRKATKMPNIPIQNASISISYNCKLILNVHELNDFYASQIMPIEFQ